MKKLVAVIIMVMVMSIVNTAMAEASILPTVTKTEEEDYGLFVSVMHYEKSLFARKWALVQEEWKDAETGEVFLIEDGNHNIIYDNEHEWLKSIGVRFENECE